MESTTFERVTIVGCGLIGGSFALAVKAANLATKIVGYSRTNSSRLQALAMGAVDQAFDDLPQAVAGSDLILIAVPVSHMQATFSAIAPHLGANTLILDVGSTKTDVIAAAEKGLESKIRHWLPCHPIAGKGQTGISHADATLFQQRALILCPLGSNTPAQIKRASALWVALGSHVHLMSAADHDQTFAAVSHLPHLLAFAYVLGLMSQTQHPDWLDRAGPGFRDFTRIAASDPVIWRDILRANHQQVLQQTKTFEHALQTLVKVLEQGDDHALQALIAQASQTRSRWRLGGADCSDSTA